MGDNLWQRGVNINTKVEDDEEKKPPDNVIIGHVGSLSQGQGEVRVITGAGDDILQLTGMVFARSFSGHSSLVGILGSGINTLSLRGTNRGKSGFLFDIQKLNLHYYLLTVLYLCVKNTENCKGKQSHTDWVSNFLPFCRF